MKRLDFCDGSFRQRSSVCDSCNLLLNLLHASDHWLYFRERIDALDQSVSQRVHFVNCELRFLRFTGRVRDLPPQLLERDKCIIGCANERCLASDLRSQCDQAVECLASVRKLFGLLHHLAM